MANNKLWKGRFAEETSSLMEKYNESLSFDKRMYAEDIQGSIAHVRMLGKQSIILEKEAKEIEKGLLQVKKEIENGEFIYDISNEDIHMAIEARLKAIIGDVAGKLHTARSRNDQSVVDERLYFKTEAKEISKLVVELQKSFVELAEKYKDTLVPGYTHLQRAQPNLLGHHFMAYYQMLKRDYSRLIQTIDRMDELPLGSCAFAGTAHPIDRHFVAKELDFARVSENSMDSVSDRDYIIELQFVLAVTSMHLSRLAEELVLWSSSEFKFITLSDMYTTGSSIMPQKKNSDAAELMRGKTGRVYGHLVAILTVMKGLPLTYNKDTQEDKEGIFDSIDTLKMTLAIAKGMLDTMTVHESNMLKALKDGFVNATEVADYLTRKNLPFRDAHEVSGKIVLHCEQNKKHIEDLTLDEMKKFSPLFENDIYDNISMQSIVEKRVSFGGASYKEVARQIEVARKELR